MTVHMEWPLPLDTEIWDCDWDDDICPVCNHSVYEHNANDLTRCANAAL